LRANSALIWLVQRVLDCGVILASGWLLAQLCRTPWDTPQILLGTGSAVLYQLVAEINGVYESFRTRNLRQELSQTLWSWALAAPPVALVGLVLFGRSADARGTAFFGSLVLCPMGLLALKAIVRAALDRMRTTGRNQRRAGIVGATHTAARLLEEVALHPEFGLSVVGIYDDRTFDRIEEPTCRERFLGGLDRAVEDARSGLIDVVYISLPFKAEDRIGFIARELADTTATVHLVADFSGFDLLRSRWGNVGSLSTVSLYDTPFEGLGGWIKRTEDILLGSVLLLLSTPILALAAIAVRLDSPGPIFFSQTRCGLNSKPFKVFKFRTMRTQEDGPRVQQATRNDPRVTRVGAFLRRTSIDELPQLLNVLLGDMSLVGPRPHAVAHNEQYRKLVHGYMLRHKVKPGITGWAQINGWRGETETLDKMEKRVEFDLDYIENWRLSWDIQIIFRTAFSLRSDKNAY
jgi:putative colanic acid biosysnthesis UDP-glucose lipid carrier transferase